jgi:hypothetical protein
MSVTAPFSGVMLDPPNVATNRVEMPLHENGIFISNAGIDWGDAQITAFEADMIIGSSVVDYRIPNRSVVINLAVFTDEFGNIFSVIKQALMQKVALLQREGGWIQRDEGLYADIVNATLAFPDVYSEAAELETNVVLTLECLPDFYGDLTILDLINCTNTCQSVLTAGIGNYVPNPSFAHDTSGDAPAAWYSNVTDTFVNAGATLQVQETGGPVGVGTYLKVTTNGTSEGQGAEVNLGVLPAGSYEASFYIGGPSGTVGDGIYAYAGAHLSTGYVELSLAITAGFVRHAFAFTSDGVDVSYLALRSNLEASTLFYMAGIMVTESAVETAYVDGDTTGYGWQSSFGDSATKINALIEGDYPARCQITIENQEPQDQLGLLWGLRSRYYSSLPTAALSIQANAMTPINGASIVSNSYAASGDCVSYGAALVSDTWTSFLVTDLANGGELIHQGSYSVWARVQADQACDFQLYWGVGDAAHYTANDAATVPIVGESQFCWVYLGPLRVDIPPIGQCKWRGFVAAYSSAGATPQIDEMIFVPLDEYAGELAAVQQTNTQAAIGLVALDRSTTESLSTLTNVSGAGTLNWTFDQTDYPGVGFLNATNNGGSAGSSKSLGSGGYGFDIPTGATIQGIAVSVEYAVTAGTASDDSVLLLRAGSPVGTQHEVAGAWTVDSDVHTRTYGGSTDLWGTTWSPADINNGEFGVAFAVTVAEVSSNYALSISEMNITIYYVVETGFSEPSDAVVKAEAGAQLGYNGMYRFDSTGTLGVPIAGVVGDLPRLPPSGLENRAGQILVRVSQGVFNSGADEVPNQQFTVQVGYRPCWLFPPY